MILAIIFFVIFTVLVSKLSHKKLTYYEKEKIKELNAKKEFDRINPLPPILALFEIENLDQELANNIYKFNFGKFNDYIVERAFLKKYRWGKVDVDFYINEVHVREIKINNRKNKNQK